MVMDTLPRWFLFVAGSASLVFVSRTSLRQRDSHGFYRFFAWEAILALVLANLPAWFRDPFSIRQVVSWLLLLASAFLALQGVWLLAKRGGSRGLVPGSGNFAFENTARLVTTGVYHFIRHPLYASLLYLAWGAYLKAPFSILSASLLLIATFSLWLTARAEEQEDLRDFGVEYAEYMRWTKKFIPFVF